MMYGTEVAVRSEVNTKEINSVGRIYNSQVKIEVSGSSLEERNGFVYYV
jgi:hypothetical protein